MWLPYKWEVHLALKPGLIHHFLQKKMPVSSQEYDSCFKFVWCVLDLKFAICSGIFRFVFSLEFSIFVILLFKVVGHAFVDQDYYASNGRKHFHDISSFRRIEVTIWSGLNNCCLFRFGAIGKYIYIKLSERKIWLEFMKIIYVSPSFHFLFSKSYSRSKYR